MRVGAIDVGTNTVLLLVAEGEHRDPVAALELATITRLGQGVDRTRRLAPDAVERTVACLADYAAAMREAGVERYAAVATSASRDAENGAEFLARARGVLGVDVRVIGGDEEAALTFEGATTGLRVSGDVTVFDIGGGSTEIVRATLGEDGVARVESAVSKDVGSVRLTERHVRSDPPTSLDLERIREDAARAFASISARPGATLVGVAGTVTTLAAIDRALATYDGARVHGAALTLDTVRALTARLARVSLAERCTITGLHPARADVIVAGAVLVEAVLTAHGATELVVSDRGVRWGVARALLAAEHAAPRST